MRNEQPILVPSQVMPWIGVVAVLVIAIYSFYTNSLLLLAAIALVPTAIFFIDRLDLLFILTITLYSSTLTLPMIPSALNGFYVSALGLAGILFARKIINKFRRTEWNASHTLMVLFGLILLMTASARGFGLRVLGSDTWGGSGYVQLFIMIALFILCDITVTKTKHWRIAFYGLCLLSMLPALAQVLYAVSGGAIYQQYNVIAPDFGAVALLKNMSDDEGLARLQPAQFVSNYACLIGLFVAGPTLGRRVLATLIIGASLVMAGVSGHRLAILLNIMLIAGFGFLNPKTNKFRFFFLLGCAGLVVVIGLAVFAMHLPLSVQRAISWIPFADISIEAKVDASGTTTWRLEMWKMLMPEIPKYLILGKGLAFRAEDIMKFSSVFRASYEDVIAMHNYHNGPLSLLIDLGLAGLLVGGGFLFAVASIHYKHIRAPWADAGLRRLHLISYTSFVVNTVVFLFLFGDARTSMPQFMLWAMILEGLVRTDRYKARRAEESPRPPPVRGIRRPPGVVPARARG